MKARLNCGLDPNLYYFRDAHGHEVDFIFQKGHELVPIEVKSSKTFNTSFLDNLHFFKKLAKERMQEGFVIYAGTEKQTVQDCMLLGYRQAATALE